MINLSTLKEKSNFVTPQQREIAVTYLLKRLSPQILLTIHDYMDAEACPHQFHLGFGQMVRNALRQEFNWDDLLLDAEWVGLIEAAASRYAAEQTKIR